MFSQTKLLRAELQQAITARDSFERMLRHQADKAHALWLENRDLRERLAKAQRRRWWQR